MSLNLARAILRQTMAESVSRLMYISNAVDPFTKDQLDALQQQCMIDNKSINVTGLLCYFQAQFIQYLEGRDDLVKDLMGRIANDPRHEVVKIINLPMGDSRFFADWNMRHFSPNDIENVFPNFVAYMVEFFQDDQVLDTDLTQVLLNNLRMMYSKQKQVEASQK